VEIIRLLGKDKPIAKLDEAALAQATVGFSGADLKWMFDRAAELVLADAIHAGRTLPITMERLLKVARSHEPSTKTWLEGLQQSEPAVRHDALYNEVRNFFQAAPKRG
jgi:transitional endoplasmic reticulum ATPase